MPKEYTQMVFSPLRARVFYLFLTVHNKFHEVHLDNIHMSAKCGHLSCTPHNCVKGHGVCQNGGQGIPRRVFQTDLHDKKAVDEVR